MKTKNFFQSAELALPLTFTLGLAICFSKDEEVKIADVAAFALAKKSGLPPYEYTKDIVTKVGASGYVYARNLAATRLYECPVVYLEPYVMNSVDVFARVQAGDYEGTRVVNGIERPSIFREYVDGVVDGLVEYYRQTRK